MQTAEIKSEVETSIPESLELLSEEGEKKEEKDKVTVLMVNVVPWIKSSSSIKVTTADREANSVGDGDGESEEDGDGDGESEEDGDGPSPYRLEPW